MFYDNSLSPDGVDDLYGDEYMFKYETIKILENVFKSFGYTQIMTPTIEYYNLYSKIEDEFFKNHMFKLIDNDGRILVLRPDATVPVARMAATTYKSTDEYLKFFYITNIFRLNKQQSGEKREFLQGGIEYFGNEKPECEGEVIAIAIKCLLQCGLDNFHIDLGQVEFLDSIMSTIDIDSVQKEHLYQLIEKKNYGELKSLLKNVNIPSDIKEVLVKIPRLYGKPEKVILAAQNLVLNKKMDEALSSLKHVYSILKDYGLEKYVFFDLGLTKSLTYYTGIIFKGYMNSFGEVLLSGGRYNKLTKDFGTYKSACGFGLNINKLVEVMEMLNIKKEKDSFTDYLILYKDMFRGKALELAEDLRTRGFVVVSDSYDKSLREYLDNPKFKNTKEIIEVNNENIKVISIYKNQINKWSIKQFIKSLESEKMLASIH